MMSKDELKMQLKKLLAQYPNSISRIINTHHHDIIQAINFYCPMLVDSSYTLATKMYWVLNDLDDFPECMNEKCQNTLEGKNVKSLKSGFQKHCCAQCAKESSERKRRYEQTCIEKYGVKNISQNESIKHMKRQKALSKYGVDNVAKADEVKTHIKKTNMQRYGTSMFMNSSEGKQQIANAMLMKYGVRSYSQTDEYHEKVKTTNLKKFGVEYPNQDPEFRKAAQSRYQFDGVNFDSKPELALYIWLKDNCDDFEFHPDNRFEYVHKGKTYSYCPDFKICGVFIEIKGLQFFKDKNINGQMVNPYDHSLDALYEAKHKCMLDNRVIIISDAQCKRYIEYAQQTHGNDIFKICKNKKQSLA